VPRIDPSGRHHGDAAPERAGPRIKSAGDTTYYAACSTPLIAAARSIRRARISIGTCR
jgi:hypothetical protein